MTVTLSPFPASTVGLLPSLKQRCPRAGCATEAGRVELSVRPVEHLLIFECPSCGYEVRETSSGMRADFEISRRQS